jgi:hypothetical protein
MKARSTNFKIFYRGKEHKKHLAMNTFCFDEEVQNQAKKDS